MWQWTTRHGVVLLKATRVHGDVDEEEAQFHEVGCIPAAIPAPPCHSFQGDR